jgi:hypothetical protein
VAVDDFKVLYGRWPVLADTQGFLIASAGEPMPQEGLAAFTIPACASPVY